MDVPLVRVKGEGGKNRPREKGGGERHASLEGRAGSVSPSCRRGRKKLKIPFSFFPQGRQ